jgi:hypothetical protein
MHPRIEFHLLITSLPFAGRAAIYITASLVFVVPLAPRVIAGGDVTYIQIRFEVAEHDRPIVPYIITADPGLADHFRQRSSANMSRPDSDLFFYVCLMTSAEYASTLSFWQRLHGREFDSLISRGCGCNVSVRNKDESVSGVDLNIPCHEPGKPAFEELKDFAQFLQDKKMCGELAKTLRQTLLSIMPPYPAETPREH